MNYLTSDLRPSGEEVPKDFGSSQAKELLATIVTLSEPASALLTNAGNRDLGKDDVRNAWGFFQKLSAPYSSSRPAVADLPGRRQENLPPSYTEADESQHPRATTERDSGRGESPNRERKASDLPDNFVVAPLPWGESSASAGVASLPGWQGQADQRRREATVQLDRRPLAERLVALSTLYQTTADGAPAKQGQHQWISSLYKSAAERLQGEDLSFALMGFNDALKGMSEVKSADARLLDRAEIDDLCRELCDISTTKLAGKDKIQTRCDLSNDYSLWGVYSPETHNALVEELSGIPLGPDFSAAAILLGKQRPRQRVELRDSERRRLHVDAFTRVCRATDQKCTATADAGNPHLAAQYRIAIKCELASSPPISSDYRIDPEVHAGFRRDAEDYLSGESLAQALLTLKDHRPKGHVRRARSHPAQKALTDLIAICERKLPDDGETRQQLEASRPRRLFRLPAVIGR